MRPLRLALLSLALVLPLLAAQAADNPNARLKQGSEELGRVREKIEAANRAIERARGAQSAQRQAVEAAERKIAETEAEVRRLAGEIAAQQERVKAAEADQAAAERALEDERERLRRQIRAAFAIGQTGRAELLLSGQDPDRAERLLTYFDYLNRASAANMAAIDAEIARVEAEREKVETALKAMRELEASRRRSLAELEADRAARSIAIAKLEREIGGDKQELKQLQDSEQSLQALMKQLRDAIAAAPPPAPSKSQKPFPEMRGKQQWPVRGELLARYGEPKADSRLQWKGLWIAAAQGTPVHASAAGRVAYTGWLSSYGLIVVIEHDRGYFTLYGHNASVNAVAGDSVAAGDVIASVGNTGGYAQYGLYFEVRRGADPLDPRDWLAR